MTTIEYQTYLHELTGLKISVKKCTGSEKGYFKFWPQYQNGEYPNFEHELIQSLRSNDTSEEPNRNGFSISEILIFGLVESDCVKFKREYKPKEISEMSVKSWGSKNSQMRLDKRSERNAKRMNKGNTARYY